MNYANHNLRTQLQEWKNRLSRVSFEQYGHQLKFLMENIENNPQLFALLKEANESITYSEKELNDTFNSSYNYPEEFARELHQVAFSYQFLNYIKTVCGGYTKVQQYLICGCMPKDIAQLITNDFITPIINYLHDNLDKTNSIIYLLEKYKKRTEWFTGKNLLSKYQSANKSYEQIFEDDLRMFLFDQGIEYPFSTPASTSGRVDVVGQIETNDPLIVEIKIFDTEKGYGQNRIKDGFSQIVKYTNDYNKNIGFLVIFNTNEVEIDFNFKEKTKMFPPFIVFANKTFYFITINLFNSVSASKIGGLKTIEITEEELLLSVNNI